MNKRKSFHCCSTSRCSFIHLLNKAKGRVELQPGQKQPLHPPQLSSSVEFSFYWKPHKTGGETGWSTSADEISLVV